MNLILNEILKALGYLFIACVVYYIYKTALDSTKDAGVKKTLLKGMAYCVGVALFTTFTLGNPSCLSSTEPGFGSTCEQYRDDGYSPTTEQRRANFIYFMVLFYFPVITGVYYGKKKSS